MLRHLRLARHRGSLTAPNSPVQDRALEYLDMLDIVAEKRARLDQVKALWVNTTTDKAEMRGQWPEFFDPMETAKKEDGTYDIDQIDDADVEWHTAGSEEEDDAISRWIADAERGSISGADLEQ